MIESEGLLKVPDSAIIKDLIKQLRKKDVEIGKLKSYIIELEYKLQNIPTIQSNKSLKKNNENHKKEIAYLKRELLNYKESFKNLEL